MLTSICFSRAMALLAAFTCFCLCCLLTGSSLGAANITVTLVPSGSIWSFLDDGSEPALDWGSLSFDDIFWQWGSAKLGYGNGDEETELSFGPDPLSRYITYYFRQSFVVEGAASYTDLTLGLLRDDGAVIYLNGTEVFRSNMPPGPIGPRTFASSDAGPDPALLYVTQSIPPSLLSERTNILAVELHAFQVTGTNLSFDLQLTGTRPIASLVRGPYLEQRTPTSMLVKWMTDLPAPSRVLYGRGADNLEFFTEDLTPVTAHEVRLIGLDPDTRYFYAIAAGTRRLAGDDSSYFFTGPSQGGSAPTTLISFDHAWRYTNVRTNLDTAWKELGYDDTQSPWEWNTGMALFGVETTPAVYPLPFNTPLALLAPGEADHTVTYYLRTHFHLSGPTFGAVLMSSNLLDDGAVFYLNGSYAGALRLPSNPHWLTFALGSPPTEGTWEELLLSTDSLVDGDNLLAVEVHQASSSSTDIAFGMSLTYAPGAPIAITRQPESQVAVTGSGFTLSVENTGTLPTYQWYKDAVLQRGSTLNTLVNNAPAPRSSGNYYVVITNAFGSITSSIAKVVVLPDTFGPRLLGATYTASNQITATFNKSLVTTPARDPANYQITSGTNVFHITAVKLSLRTVQITTEQPLVLSEDWNYVLTVNNLRDSTANTNIIAPNSQIAIACASVTNLFGWDQTWRYNQSETNDALGTAWMATDYAGDDPNREPFHWVEGQGVFAFDQSDTLQPCSPIQTFLFNSANTTYFRTTFNLPTNYPSATSLIISNLVDDGAIFYLNGQEVLRTRMPSGAVNFFTGATSINVAPCLSKSVVVTNLIVGRNVFAAEVHQAQDFQGDVAFGAALSLSLPFAAPLPPEPLPRLEVAYLDPNRISLSWTNGHGFALEGTGDPNGIWLEVANMSTNTIIEATSSFRLFRLHKVN